MTPSLLLWAALVLSLTPGFQPPRDAASNRSIAIASSVTGRVLDDRGTPVAGAFVALTGGLSAPDTLSAITSDDGGFAFAAVPSGHYRVSAAKAGFSTFQARTPIEVREPLTLPIRLPRGAVITGTVVDHEGTPVPQVGIGVARADGQASRRLHVYGDHSQSNSRGEFRIFGLAAGTYRIGRPSPMTGQIDQTSASVVTVAAAEERGDIVIRIGLPDSRTNVTVVPVADGAVLRQPEVRLRRPAEWRAAYSYGSRNADGSVTMSSVAAGTYKAIVRSGDYWGSTDVTVAGDQPITVAVTATRGARVRGRVVGDMGDSRGVSVQLKPVDVSSLPGTDAPLEARMNPDGTFTFASIPPGRYVAAMPNYSGRQLPFFASAMLGQTDVTDLPFDVGAADVDGLTLTVTSNPVAALRGVVTTATGAPVSLIDVVVFPFDTRLRTRNSRLVTAARTSVRGEYQIWPLAPGRYAIAVVDDVDPEALKDPAVLAGLTPVGEVRVAAGETKLLNVTVK